MSKYTTELRYVALTYTQFDTDLNEYPSVSETIEKAIPYIFDDSWTTYDPEHKDELCKKILRHYWMREIGEETPSLWKMQLNEYLAEIMPKYNIMYANLDKVKDVLLQNADYTETKDTTGNVKQTGSQDSTGHTEGKTTDTNKTTDKGTQTTTGTTGSTTTGKTSGSSDGWQESNDTPQGGLDGIESRKYLSNAVHNRGTTSGDQSQTANGTNNQTVNTDNTQNSDGSGTSTQDTTGNINTSGNTDSKENYILKVIGKNNGSSYIDEFLKLQKDYDDIDLMIIRDLNVCFIQLW